VRPSGFPYLTGEQMKTVLSRPRFRYQDKAAKPRNLAEAEGIASPCKRRSHCSATRHILKPPAMAISQN
jgi:hypothetical protein